MGNVDIVDLVNVDVEHVNADVSVHVDMVVQVVGFANQTFL